MIPTSRALSLAIALLAGCPGGHIDPILDTEEDSDSGDPDTADPDTEDPDTDVGTEPDPDPSGDEALVRALIAGSGDADEVLRTVAWSGGWPVATARGTWLVVTEDTSRRLFVAGDFDGWAGVQLTAAADFQWAEITVPDPVGSQYKLRDAGGSWFMDPWSRAWGHDEFGYKSYVRAPVDAAHLDRWPDVEPARARRDVNVWVPPGAGPWPTLYAHDGQNLFFDGGIYGSWHLEAPLATRPMLVVAIDSNGSRFDDYTHVADDPGIGLTGGGADVYEALLSGVIRPHVEDRYPTSGVDGLMGSSLGGLVSLYIAQAEPAAWDFTASLSGSLYWGRASEDGPLMEELWLDRSELRAVAVYVDSGGDAGVGGACTDPDGDGFPADDPDDSDSYCMNRHFADALAGEGWTWQTDLWHWHEPGAAHSEAAWAARVHRPLDAFLTLP